MSVRFSNIIIDITTRCNLSCPVCYMGNESEKKDLPMEKIRMLAQKYQNKIISLSGGEPTLRDDLPEIIRLFNRKNTVFLVTNGLKLVDYNYLKELEKSGLRYISFSFNGISDDVYWRVNGAPLLDTKMKALENIKKTKIKIILSVLIVKGINEDQVASVLDYCAKNRDFIDELRIRSMVPCGRYLPCESYSAYELLNLVCKRGDVKIKDILNEVRLQEKINAVFRREVFKSMDCSLNFYLINRSDSGWTALGKKINVNRLDGFGWGWIFMVNFEILRTYGIKMIIKGLFKNFIKYEKMPWVHSRNVLKIGLRSWPDLCDFNLREAKKCQTAYYVNGNLVPFCYARIQKDG